MHHLNWDEDHPVKNVRVSLLLPAGRRVESIGLLSPDPETDDRRLEYEITDGRLHVTVPHLLCYNIFVRR